MESTERLTMRQEQAQQTKRRLFDAAYALLQEKDFRDITIGEIVSRAGVSTGTFYLYYSSKLDVYYQTYQLADAYFAGCVAPKVQSGTALERLLVYFEHYAHYNSDYTSIKLTKLLYNGDNGCFLRSGSTGMQPILLDILSYGIRSGELDASLNADEMAHYVMCAVRGLVYDWCIRDGAYALGPALRAFVTRLYRSIRA